MSYIHYLANQTIKRHRTFSSIYSCSAAKHNTLYFITYPNAE